MLLVDFEDGFDLDGDSEGEGAGSHGASCSDPVLGAEDVGEELTGSVDDGGLLVEVGGAVDHPEEFDHAADPVECAEGVFHGGEDAEGGQLGRLVAGVDVVVVSQLALEDFAVGGNGRWPEV